jgi:hypothetical protein
MWMIPLSVALAAQTTMGVQGVITATDGSPQQGTQPVTLRLTTAADGSGVVFEEPHSVAFHDGAFATTLGASVGLDAELFRDNPELYLTARVGVGAWSEAIPVNDAPRAAYARLAGDASSVGGLTPGELLTTTTGYTRAEVDGAIGAATTDIPWSALNSATLPPHVASGYTQAQVDTAIAAARTNLPWSALNSATLPAHVASGYTQAQVDAAIAASRTNLPWSALNAASLPAHVSSGYTRAEVDAAIATATSGLSGGSYNQAQINNLLVYGSTSAPALAARIKSRPAVGRTTLYYLKFSTARQSGIGFYATGGPVAFESSIPIVDGSHLGCRYVVDGVPAEAFSIGDPGYQWESGIEYGADGWNMWDATRVYEGILPGYHVLTVECINDSSSTIGQANHNSMTQAVSVIPYDPIATAEVKAYGKTVMGGQTIPVGSGWVAVTGLSHTITTTGGPVRIGYQIPMTDGSHSTCRTLVDGTPAGAVEGDNTAYIWQEGLIYTVDGWGMWSRERVFEGISAGLHTFTVQCRTDSGTVGLGNDRMTLHMTAVTYPQTNAVGAKTRAYRDNHIGQQGIAVGSNWVTYAPSGLSLTFTSNGGPVEIGMSIPMETGSHSACRPIVDGAPLTAGEPDVFSYIWHNGIVYTADGWAMWDRTRIYHNIPAGTHTLQAQCRTDSGTVYAGHGSMQSHLFAVAFDN